MRKAHPDNERIKRRYFDFLRQAKGRDETTVDRTAASLARFEAHAKGRDFRRFHHAQAVAFKAALADALNARTGEKLAKATVASTLRDLRAFFEWLSREPGYRSVAYADAEYFNLPAKDLAIARAAREPDPPTPEQLRRVLDAMPSATVLERRDRAVVAFAALTGVRVSALASIRLGHVDVGAGTVEQDARTVDTKASKTIRSDFHRLVPGAEPILAAWVGELERDHAFGPGDPLFPRTRMGLDGAGAFVAEGLDREPWASTEPIRAIFRRAFAAAGLPYKNPHALRAMLVRGYMAMTLTPEQLKAVSQSLGHAQVNTTLTSYGTVATHRQRELIRAIGERPACGRATPDMVATLEALLMTAKAQASTG